MNGNADGHKWYGLPVFYPCIYSAVYTAVYTRIYSPCFLDTCIWEMGDGTQAHVAVIVPFIGVLVLARDSVSNPLKVSLRAGSDATNPKGHNDRGADERKGDRNGTHSCRTPEI